YINLARREIAGRTQCIRRLTPISGQVISANVTAGGSGYVKPVATITPPDFPSGYGANPNGLQATASVEFIGGVVTGVTITNGGDGYFEPIIMITDENGPGVGATATLSLSPINTLNQGQEVYNFSDIYVGNWPGVDSVYMIKSVSVIYTNYRYSLPMYAFSTYQAAIRSYPFQYNYVPSFCSQLGQGANGSLYMYPLPSQTYQYELDCFCLPLDLTMDNGIPEAIPQPWCDVVQYMAVQLAFQELGNLNSAKYYEQQFDKLTLSKSAISRPGRMTNPYGRYIWLVGAIPILTELLTKLGSAFS
ncbi:MAG: hypothetical protein KGJ13_10360, partial [Patescibacteria group bacterium]|nr:hypothetical protein [Patescibacteria group bacterium]